MFDSFEKRCLDRTGKFTSNISRDPREGSRTRTVLRVVRVESAQDDGLARLQNISDGGLMLRARLPMYLGDTLTIHFADDKRVQAKVVWTDGENCGVQFSNAIDSASLLVEMAEQTRDGSMRAVRLPTDVNGLAYTERGIHPIRVKDISQRGMKLNHQSAFVEGLPIKICLSSGLERRGIVRWSRDNVAGIQLTEPLSLDDLGSAVSFKGAGSASSPHTRASEQNS